MDENDQAPTTKRTDVGYKRPPREHQFKAGQKPPPRKRRANKPQSNAQVLAMILGEERRLTQGKKARWFTNGELVMEVAFQLAENDNSTVARALADYLLASDKPEVVDDMPLLEYEPEGPTDIFHYIRRVKI